MHDLRTPLSAVLAAANTPAPGWAMAFPGFAARWTCLRAVHNHGTPIHEPDCARIFEPLVRVAETSSPVISSHLGLGLYIVSQIVQAHGSTIEVQSTESAGTTFAVSLQRP